MVSELDIEKVVLAAIQEIQKSVVKPEHMTHLSAHQLVDKTNPVIAFRGAIDTLEAEIILVQHKVSKLGMLTLDRALEEIRVFVHDLIRCEISGDIAKIDHLCGLTDKEIRDHSHHPGKYYGISHFVPSKAQGEVPGYINKLRTLTRQTELMACNAFKKDNVGCVTKNSNDGGVTRTSGVDISQTSGELFTRTDIIQTLNRLSSLFHVVMIRCIHGDYPREVVEVEVSGRHIHLSVEDKEKIFGKGYTLTRVRDLSQPGQYVCKERLTICGPKGCIENVVVLGPERKQSQVEISMTDARVLGIEPVVRQSGHVENTPGCRICYKDREIHLTQGVMVAGRHIHMEPEDARRMDIKDGDYVSLEMHGDRGLTFHHVLVRVSDQYATYAHIDYDEANACGLGKNNLGIIIKESQK